MDEYMVYLKLDKIYTETLSALFEQLEIETGDVTPEQSVEIDALLHRLATLTVDILEQNDL